MKKKDLTPGPGSYRLPSEFGYYEKIPKTDYKPQNKNNNNNSADQINEKKS